ncbi:hypothetical protein [Pantanalinema sp. GBBB05]|uniref:hypothetical protein n=1 Tax=Pantanalinema sp. GBBB05 TaxID=2604139 RepID=UPI001D790D74|nr:hypothetical protein [Pantanalinema sp. GBBB05]
MSPPVDSTDGFYTEQTWQQWQHERHQRFLTQLKAEFYALRQLSIAPRSIPPRISLPTASATHGQRPDRASSNTATPPSISCR